MLISFLVTREWRNWQTRTVQVRVPVRAWGFKSPLAHHEKAPEASGAFFRPRSRRPARGLLNREQPPGALKVRRCCLESGEHERQSIACVVSTGVDADCYTLIALE